MLKDKLAKINSSLPILILGEIIYLIVGEIIILFLPLDRIGCMTGLAIGVGLAAFSSVQTAIVLNSSVSATKRKKSAPVMGLVLRLSIEAVVVVCAFFFGFANPVAILIGMLSIQAGVYFAPARKKDRYVPKKDDSAKTVKEQSFKVIKGGLEPREMVESTSEETVKIADKDFKVVRNHTGSEGTKIRRK